MQRGSGSSQLTRALSASGGAISLQQQYLSRLHPLTAQVSQQSRAGVGAGQSAGGKFALSTYTLSFVGQRHRLLDETVIANDWHIFLALFCTGPDHLGSVFADQR
jgi:hypothetical protein